MSFYPTNNPVFWKETADTLLSEERFFKAAEAYLRLCELTPNDHEAWRGRGFSLLGLEKYAEAADSFERALVLFPDDITALEGLAEVCGNLGDVEKMTACFVRISDLSQFVTK